MFIKEITFKAGNDFKAVFCCEHCGYTHEKWGYDDAYFHKVVIPQEKCPECGLAGKDKVAAEAFANDIIKKFVETYNLNIPDDSYNIFSEQISKVLMGMYKYRKKEKET